jgi:hypothetical protein
MIITFTSTRERISEMLAKRKEAIDWLETNIGPMGPNSHYQATRGNRHAVGQTQQEADDIWKAALLKCRADTNCQDIITEFALHESENWSLYSTIFFYPPDDANRYALFIIIPDDVAAVQCKLALS